MNYEFEKVLDGLTKYINEELLSQMNEVQEFFVRVLLGRVLNNKKLLKESLMNNGFFKTFGLMDSEGKIRVGELACDIKRELTRQGKITFDIPLLGRLTFKPLDIDCIYRNITNEELINFENN